MIKKVEMFTVICDNCGVDAADEQDYSCCADETSANDAASNSEWHIEGETHYCPDCFKIDDNDKLVIKPNQENYISN